MLYHNYIITSSSFVLSPATVHATENAKNGRVYPVQVINILISALPISYRRCKKVQLQHLEQFSSSTVPQTVFGM